MNGMANLPQFYQDMMRSHFVNAFNQHQQLATLQTGHVPQQQIHNASSSGASHLANTPAQQQQAVFFQQQQQQQMAAAVAAVQAHVQKQQHTNYVNQIQAQMNAVAAAAAASVAQNSLKNTSQTHQMPTTNLNSPIGFQYPQKSFFMPSNLDQIKNTINSFYQQHNQQATHPGTSLSKENLLLHHQDLMQQQIEQASKKHNTLARSELNKAKQIQQNRGRGRPRRQLELTNHLSLKRSSPSSSPNSAESGKTESPRSNKSRSRSPVRNYKHQKKSHSENVTRTSTPSKFSQNSDSLEIEQGNCEQNSIISKSGTEEYDETNRDLSLYDYENRNRDLEEEIDEDMLDNIDEEDESQNSIKEEELNTTSSTVMTSKSSRQNRQDFNVQKMTEANGVHKPSNKPVYDFTMQALEMSLYGYLRQTDPKFASHAISGLRIPQFNNPMLSQGIEFKKENNSSSSSSNSSITNSDQSLHNHTHQQHLALTKSQSSSTSSKKSNFSIENLLTSSSSPSSSSSSSSLSLQQQPFHLLNQHYQQQLLQLQNQKQQPDIEKIELPDELQIRQTVQQDLAHYGVFCKKTVILKSTRFGPFPGKALYPNEIKPNEDNSHMWEIFNDGRLSHFIDGRNSCGQNQPSQKSTQLSPSSSYGSNSNNSGTVNQWMIYVNCARFAQEQNMIAVQLDGEIFYEVCKDIVQGQELLVWYGDSYLQFLGIPVSLKDMTDEISEDTTENKDGYSCDRCGKVFAYKYYRDKHLKYTRCVDQGDRKFPCHLCTRSFEKRDRLRIHILHVHEKHRPHKCTVCGKSFSQSSSLNKHMRVHSGERPYKCVYCNKAFTASSILRTHIRQHSGEKPFKCKYCGKAFASHAAHDSHVRRTHNITKDKEATLIL